MPSDATVTRPPGGYTAGTVLDRYEVVRLLGQGGMASVYEVRHRTLGSAHALKLLSVPDRALRERLLAEGRMLATLRHPNLVCVTDALDVDGEPALVLELVRGPDLASRLAGRALPWAVAEPIFRGIVAGVASAHAAGLVHRDLKPANVLMDGDTPKVADFGIARALDDDGPRLTRSRLAMGTPAYMAPEQFTDASRVDARADVWSLGCILYELVCGRPAFHGALGEIMRAAAFGSYPDPDASLPPAVRATVRGCLEPTLDARIPSCEAILRALDTTPTAVAEPPPTAIARSRSTPVGLVLGAVGLAALVVGVGWYTDRAEAPVVDVEVVPSSPPLEAAAQPAPTADASLAAVGSTATGSPAAAVLANPPTEAAPVATSRPPPTSPSTPSAATAPVAVTTAPASSAATGQLAVLCFPRDTAWCRAVEIDGDRHTEGLGSLAAAAGAHQVTVEGPDGLRASTRVTIGEGATARLRCIFDESPARCAPM